MKRFLYIAWREYGDNVLLAAIAFGFWLFFALSTYGCSSYTPKVPDGCDVDLATITARCSAKIELCDGPVTKDEQGNLHNKCVDETQAACDREVEEACR